MRTEDESGRVTILDGTATKPKDKSQISGTDGDKPFIVDSNQTGATVPKKMSTASLPVNAIPNPPEQTNENSSPGGGSGLVLFIGLVITLTVGLGLWFYLRRRLQEELAEAPDAPPKPSRDKAPTPTTFQCSGCKKKLRVKAGLAGKKIKCPQCGIAVLVP